MIPNFVRDNSYFQSLFENNADVNSKDFDTELNNFVNFLNKKVVTSINNIATKSYNGVIGNNNYILKNIGNGKVVFDKLKDVNYQNNSIAFSKIKKIQPYSLPFVNINYELIFYQYEKDLKLEGGNFYDKSIKSNNIDVGTITNEHVSSDGKLFLLKNIELEARHIIDSTILNNSFAYCSITYNKLHPDIKSIRESGDLKYEDSSVTLDKVKDNSFDFRLISTNLDKFGYGILHKNVIPINSVPIAKPDEYANETIDTYKLCIYSIANAYQLNTYQDPLPDKVYVNPAYIEKLNLYNSVNKQLIDASNYLTQLYNSCIFQGICLTESNIDIYISNNPIFSTMKKNYRNNIALFNSQKKFYNSLYEYLININRDLQQIPKNIYVSSPPLIYQKLEAVPNEKSYLLHREQQDIKSRHLKDNMFNITNIPDRITYNNVPSEKFINKYKLSPELRDKLGLVI